MKVLKFSLPLFSLAILIVYLINPQVFRIIRYQKPQTDTGRQASAVEKIKGCHSQDPIMVVMLK